MSVRYRYGNKKTIFDKISGQALGIIMFFIILPLFVFAVSGIAGSSLDRQEKALRSAIERSVVNCYCVEGTYPPSLDYIVEHYGLTYDEDTFFVDYMPIGANILPDVTIMRRGEE